MNNLSINGIVLNYRDVTDRNKIESKLLRNKERFKALIEKSSDVIVIVNSSAKAIYRSSSYKRIMGNEIKNDNNNIFNFVHEDDKERMRTLFNDLVKRNVKFSEISFKYNRKDGKVIDIEGTAQNMLDEPNITGIILNYRDVTEKLKVKKN